MSTRLLAVVTAGMSQPSSTRLLADRLAASTTRALANNEIETETNVIELRRFAHDIANNLLTGFPNSNLRTVIDQVKAADGMIAVTPVFTASYSGLFKSFFDVLDIDAVAGLPVLLAATGGTERHTLVLEHAMRPMFTYLRSIVVPTSVYAASSDWGTVNGSDGANAALGGRIDQAAGELADLMRAGTATDRPDPYDDPTPFEELLES